MALFRTMGIIDFHYESQIPAAYQITLFDYVTDIRKLSALRINANIHITFISASGRKYLPEPVDCVLGFLCVYNAKKNIRSLLTAAHA